ncbi:MAG TPA: hypothetical protein VNK24_08805 [Elusimicrobiota bacterium]|nr:hypothetical protein [Elusimicrobiota bacterium]
MRARLPRKIPAAFSFAPEIARQDAWGWLEEISASRARLSTLCALRLDERLFLDFSIGDRRLGPGAARVSLAEKGEDGFFRAELAFTDELFKRKLSRAILRMLAAAA